MELVTGTVCSVRGDRSLPNHDVVHIELDDQTSDGTRMFSFRVPRRNFVRGDKVRLRILGHKAEIVS
ncbi:MAG TPA: hypothetical protein VF597_01195 [Candidatus Saccharimonadales bacterium]